MIAGHHVRPPAPEFVALGLGSNQGDRLGFLRRGVHGLAALPGLDLQRFSRVWETEFVGDGVQDSYLNLVCCGTCSLAPAELLAAGKALEARLGRPAGRHQLPRTLDVDLVLFGARQGGDQQLQLPHPRARERAFVLAPLAEVAPAAIFPDSGETAAAAWARIEDAGGPWLRPWAESLVEVDPCRDGEEDWRAALAVHCR